ncbi:unnamed protein product [Phytophthora fragariaefolia]|uniref:Unnamed protein product n=1 Tax=Phytophthora fragariaefolia TaxID=1490495 RepID=A0A9W7D821_9STRA|nr:unnamed protein product [Phytophthora fragariaefolia]
MESEDRVRVAADAGSSTMAVEAAGGADHAVSTLAKSTDVEKEVKSGARTAAPTGREDDVRARCWNEMRIRHGGTWLPSSPHWQRYGASAWEGGDRVADERREGGPALSETVRETNGQETDAGGNVQLTTDSEPTMAPENAGDNEAAAQRTTDSGAEVNDDTVVVLGSMASVRRILKQTKKQVKLQRVQQAQQR